LDELIGFFRPDFFVEFINFLFKSFEVFCVKVRVFMVGLCLIMSERTEDLMSLLLEGEDVPFIGEEVLFVIRELLGPLFVYLAKVQFSVKVEFLVFFLENYFGVFLVFTLVKVIVKFLY
jgi:hypothetical protein